MKTAIVGLGLIGSEWAKHLHADGLLAATWNRTPKLEFPLYTPNLAELPARATIIHVVVSDEEALLSVIRTLAPGLTAAHRIIQSTTVDSGTSSEAKAIVEDRGARYLEAPFTGSLPAAQQRQTIFFLGGDNALIEELLPYLRHLSQKWFIIGTNEQACALKLSMNLQIASAMEALAEALTICRGSGISDEVFFRAFRENASYSGVAKLKENKLQDHDFAPQFSVKHMAKDMRLLQTAQGEGFPVLDAVRSVLKNAQERGLGDLDFSAVIKLLNQ